MRRRDPDRFWVDGCSTASPMIRIQRCQSQGCHHAGDTSCSPSKLVSTQSAPNNPFPILRQKALSRQARRVGWRVLQRLEWLITRSFAICALDTEGSSGPTACKEIGAVVIPFHGCRRPSNRGVSQPRRRRGLRQSTADRVSPAGDGHFHAHPLQHKMGTWTRLAQSGQELAVPPPTAPPGRLASLS